jgi:uncharacterized protein (DUF4415 family)
MPSLKQTLVKPGTSTSRDASTGLDLAASSRPKPAAKKHISLRLDVDVVAFYRARGAGYLSRMNDLLNVAAAEGKFREEGDGSSEPWVHENGGHSAMDHRVFRPRKEQITLRIDPEVITFFQAQGPGYQSRMNHFLRKMMVELLLQQEEDSAEKNAR